MDNGQKLDGGYLPRIPAAASLEDTQVFLNNLIDRLNNQLESQQFSDGTTKPLLIGKLPNGGVGLQINDSNGVPLSLFGRYPDGTVALKTAKPNIDVTTAGNNDLVFNSAQNGLKIANIVDYTYKITSADYSNQYINLSIPHTLDYGPVIFASFSNTSDGLKRPVPFNLRPDTTTYYGGGVNDKPGASLEINRIDNTFIYVQIKINDAIGLSYFLTNATLKFKIYCFQESIVA